MLIVYFIDFLVKIKIFRQKRKDDYDKLREYERLKIQLETLQNFKQEMTSAHTILKKENADLRRVTSIHFFKQIFTKNF